MTTQSHQGPGLSAGSEDIPYRPNTPGSGSLAVERRLLRRLLEQLGCDELMFVLWDGRSVSVPGAAPVFRLMVRDRGALWLLLAFPEYYFPEMYVQGRILVEGGLERLLELIQDARRHQDPNNLPRRLACALFRPSAGSPAQARENIHHHYDLGNDFYRLWLDRRMLYTSAYFTRPDLSLEQAQVAKMDHVCRKLRLQPKKRVIKTGCG